MPTKINSFIFSDDMIKDMKDLSKKSISTGREYGFNLCTNEKDEKYEEYEISVRPGQMCKGEKCSIEVAEFRCKDDEKTIGIFHTHPTSPNPSMSDLSLGYLVGMNCIGSSEGIKCFKRKKDFDALAFADIKNVQYKEEQTKFHHSRWKSKEISNAEYMRIYSEYKKEIDRVIKDHFEETKISDATKSR